MSGKLFRCAVHGMISNFYRDPILLRNECPECRSRKYPESGGPLNRESVKSSENSDKSVIDSEMNDDSEKNSAVDIYY